MHDPGGNQSVPRQRSAPVLPLSSVSLDHFTRLVQRLLRSPVSLVSVVEGDDQVFRAASGLSGVADEQRRTPLTHSLCRHVIGRGDPLVVADARTDPRTATEPAVLESGVGAYAGFPLHGADGSVVGSLCAVDVAARAWAPEDLDTLRDLALACSVELQHRAQQVAVSDALTRALLDVTGALVTVYDGDERLVLANDHARAAAEVAGLDLDRPRAGSPEVRRPDNRTPMPPEEQVLSRALDGEEVDAEVGWFGPLGRERAAAVSSRRLLHPDGSFWATVVSAHDVTALARALQVKESFVSSVSHELRTPLAAVLGYAELLDDELRELAERGTDTTRAGHVLGVIQRRAVDLQARIADLLDMTDLRRRLDLTSVDVAAVARRVAAGFVDAASAQRQRLHVDTKGPQRALLDERRVTQALENLLSNAVKYAGPGGSIDVVVRGTPSEVVVTVRDDGEGMSSGEVEQAFDQFWRSTSAHEGAVPGLGIGLSLVRDIVAAHHGTVELRSSPGHGARFVVRLPRSPGAVA